MQLKNEDCSVDFVEMPFCESCGENHEHFGAQIFDGSTCWCLCCADANGYLTKEEYKHIEKEEKRLTKEFFKKQLDK